MGDKLMPCPFCGRKPSLAKGQRYKRDGMYEHQKAGAWIWSPAISCRSCHISRDFDSVEDALAWWNKRAVVKPARLSRTTER